MGKTAAIILAAGASTRLGEPKQLFFLGGERLLERAVRVARDAGCAPVVVLGANADEVLAGCELGSAHVVRNAAWADGMASSLRLGIEAVAGEVDAAIVMTCDQPAVTPDHLRRLMVRCGDRPVASSYAGRRGVPACFPGSGFLELLRLRGDAGARQLLETAETVELMGGELDIDTAEDLATARQLHA